MAYKALTTKELDDLHGKHIAELFAQGYTWDKKLSISSAGVALIKGKDLWLFDLEGNKYHNPKVLLSIKL